MDLRQLDQTMLLVPFLQNRGSDHVAKAWCLDGSSTFVREDDFAENARSRGKLGLQNRFQCPGSGLMGILTQ